MKKEDEEKKKRIEQISKHLHPHDDEPDPTAYMGNYNFPQMLFAFCPGAGTIFVAACLLYTSPSPRDQRGSRMPSSA